MPHPEGYLLTAFRHLPKKARTGIYQGKHVDVVNRVSAEYEVRSRKYVWPNVHKVHLYSQALGRKIKLPVTTAALRAIDAAGGLDRYLLKTPDSLLHSDVASNLKFQLSHMYRYQQHEQQQRQRLLRQAQQNNKQPQLRGRPRLQQTPASPLEAMQAAQWQAATAGLRGGSKSKGQRQIMSGSLLPPVAAAAAARPHGS